jgi:hypothetical protein
MAVVQFILGVALLAVGTACVFARERIVARHARSSAHTVQAPMAYLVLGVILGLAGAAQVASALH